MVCLQLKIHYFWIVHISGSSEGVVLRPVSEIRILFMVV